MSFQMAEDKLQRADARSFLFTKLFRGERDWAFAQLDGSLPGEGEELHGTNAR